MSETTYTPSDYKSDQAVRWCPGCGDHAILNTLHKAMATLGIAPHRTADCLSRHSGNSPLFCNFTCNLTICNCPSIGNHLQDFPYCKLKRRPF